MTKSSNETSQPRRAAKFTYRRGSFGCDSTFDVVFKPTGQSIACLNYWEEEAETLRDTKLLIRALNRMERRGGYFFLHAMDKVNDCLDPYHDLTDGGGV